MLKILQYLSLVIYPLFIVFFLFSSVLLSLLVHVFSLLFFSLQTQYSEPICSFGGCCPACWPVSQYFIVTDSTQITSKRV